MYQHLRSWSTAAPDQDFEDLLEEPQQRRGVRCCRRRNNFWENVDKIGKTSETTGKVGCLNQTFGLQAWNIMIMRTGHFQCDDHTYCNHLKQLTLHWHRWIYTWMCVIHEFTAYLAFFKENCRNPRVLPFQMRENTWFSSKKNGSVRGPRWKSTRKIQKVKQALGKT